MEELIQRLASRLAPRNGDLLRWIKASVDHIAAVRRGLKDQAEISLKGHRETLIVSRNFTHPLKQM